MARPDIAADLLLAAAEVKKLANPFTPGGLRYIDGRFTL
jgi:hypothetical protein